MIHRREDTIRSVPGRSALLLPACLAWCMVLVGSCVPAGILGREEGAYDDYVGPARAAETGLLQETSDPARPDDAARREGPDVGLEGLTVREAILLALEGNRAFSIERLGPALQNTLAEGARAAFDPELTGELGAARGSGIKSYGPIGPTELKTSSGSGELAVRRRLSTGTEVEVDLSAGRSWSDTSGGIDTARVGLTVTQSLLRGAGRDANLATLRAACLDVQASEYELRGLAEALVADVEKTYWDYALAERSIRIFEESLGFAGRQLHETEERITVGKLPETELAAARAEVALRREALINARSALATRRLRLLRLLNPPGAGLWDRKVVLRDVPVAPARDVRKHVREHVAVALRMRPELNQARLGIRRGDLEIVRTRNGLLPRMDLFVTLGKSGYADSFADSWGDLDGDSYDASIGLSFDYAFGNRDARASHLRAELSRRQAELALENLEQLVQVDVRSAYIEVNRAREQVTATTATRRFREESHRVETEKFRVGKSTALLVAQAQRDLVESQISEIRAVVNHLKALVELHRAEGSLLDRRGIAAPGRPPPDAPTR